MSRKPPSSAERAPIDICDRDRMEIIRFATDDSQKQAIQVLMDRGMLNFSSNRHEEWVAGGSL